MSNSQKILTFLIILLSVSVYFQVYSFDYIPTWDDNRYVKANDLIKELSFNNLKDIFLTPVVSAYTPLPVLSYAFEYAVFGPSPGVFHITNMLLHVCVSVLLFHLLTKMSGSNYIGFSVALLFSLHPINVESVAWISQRKTLMSALFLIIAFSIYTKNTIMGKKQQLSVLLFSLLAFLSKPTAIILPILLILYDYFEHGKLRSIHLIFAISVLAALSAAPTIYYHTGEGATLGIEPSLLINTVYPTSAVIYWIYIYLLVLPVNLSGYYDARIFNSPFEWEVVLSVFAWIFVSVLIYSKGSKKIKFWYLWFWICLLPVSNIIPINTFYADRFLYLSQIGFYMILMLGLKKGVEKLQKGKTICYATPFCVVLICAFLTFNRLDVWRNELSFWQDTADKSPLMYKAQLNLGVAYEKRGDFREAKSAYLNAVKIWNNPEIRTNLRGINYKIDNSPVK